MSLLTVKRAYVVRVPTNSEPSKVICRICRKQCTPRDQVELFRNTTLRANASMLALIADIKIIPNDRLPTVICQTCNNILEKAYVLRTVAQNSDKLFRKHLMERQAKGSPAKKVLNQKSPNKQNIQIINPKEKQPSKRVGNARLSKNIENVVFGNIIDDVDDDMFKREPEEVDTTEQVSTSHDDMFSDMNDTSDVKEIEIAFEDDGFSQAEQDSDPDYSPSKAEEEDDENKPKKVVVSRKLSTFTSKVTVKPRSSLMPKGSKPKVNVKDIRQFLMLQKQHVLKEKQRLKNEAERRMRVRVQRKLKPKEKSTREEETLCSICGTLAKNMNAHLKQHMEKNLKCNVCPKLFKTMSHLNAHMKHHMGVRDFKCDLCDAAFYEKKGLVRHMLMHTQTRPYPCKICGKSFSYSNVLRNHMDIHLNRKPHSCEVCDRPFRTKKHLKTHMIIHTGEKPFSCEICDQHFAYKVNLNQHMARSHSVNWKYKSIPTVTTDILEQERAKDALKGILPYMQSAQHEITVTTSETNFDCKDDMLEIDEQSV